MQRIQSRNPSSSAFVGRVARFRFVFLAIAINHSDHLHFPCLVLMFLTDIKLTFSLLGLVRIYVFIF
jgi:hypothetical protein